MAENNISLKDATTQADHLFRRALAVFLALGVFSVGTILIAGFFGDDTVQDNWIWAGLAGAGALFAFYAAQKDNRDFKSGRISAIVTSTLKDYTATGLGAFAVATILSVFGVAPFNIVVAASAAALLAKFVFDRNWVPLAK